MSTYSEASQLKSLLHSLIKEEIENNETVKSCIKARKAVVWAEPNTTNKTVRVKFLSDIMSDSEPLEFPYNPRIESYLTSAAVGKSAVSVWFYQNVNNGIVMQDGNWNI